MKKYICDICGCEMSEERHIAIPIRSFDGEEKFNIKCFDHCGHNQADICKKCEDQIKNAINESITACIRGDGLGAHDSSNCYFYENGNCCNCNREEDECTGICGQYTYEKPTASESIEKYHTSCDGCKYMRLASNSEPCNNCVTSNGIHSKFEKGKINEI